jgi:diguanylate cyclase (GGDEF)-like protein
LSSAIGGGSEVGRVRRELRRPPPAPEPQARALALGRMYLGGGALGLLSLAVAADRGLPRGALIAACVLALVAGSVLLKFGRRVPPWLLHVLLVMGSVTVAASAHVTGSPGVAVVYGMLTVWVGLYAGLFFNPAVTTLHTAVAIGLSGATLASLGGPFVFELVWIAGVSAMVAGVTNWMSYRRAGSHLDPLTGLPGRRGLADLLASRMLEAEASGTPLTVGVLDLDAFRSVNDRDGPGAGDELLRSCVAHWLPSLPPGASLARRGSDEFVVVLPGLALEEGWQCVDRLRTTLPRPTTCSAGVTVWSQGDTQSMILARADTALYAAKVAGRDRTEATGGDAEVVADLRRALDEDEIVLHYQPIHAVDDGRLVGLEALVRWEHPEHGLLGPAAFLPVAEASGVIQPLGRRVLHLACAQLQRWRVDHPHHERLRIAVNLSTRQLTDPRLLDDIEQALQTHGLEPRSLILEITEGALADEHAEKAAILWEVRERGVRLAIDDFGTGHSSLSRLRSLPFDVVKIDRSFVQPLGEGDPAAEALFSVIVRMAESLGMATVAEGLEHQAELDRVGRLGATYAQGYLLRRPAPPDELAPVLADRGLASMPEVIELPRDEAADADPEGTAQRVLRSLLVHVTASTGFEVAYLTRVDLAANEQVVLAAHNVAPERLAVAEGARVAWSSSICRHALRQGGRTGRPEVRSPLVGDHGVRAYVTAPIELGDGSLWGTLCAISVEDRQVGEDAEQVMAFVARLVAAQVQDTRDRVAAAAPGARG